MKGQITLSQSLNGQMLVGRKKIKREIKEAF